MPTPTPSPHVAVVGAGPAALAIALALDCQDATDGLEIIDPSGSWLAAWDRRFAAQDIEHLRSPAVHHPHPDPFAFLADADDDDLVPSGTTRLPRTDAFRAFVDRAVRDAALADRITPHGVRSLTLDPDGRATIGLTDGTSRRPDHLVLATNHRIPAVPAALDAVRTDERIRTGDRIDLAATPAGGRVLVIGGGLSAAHLAIGATRRGARVVLAHRRAFRVRRFDTHPRWLGPSRLGPFRREPDPRARRRMIDEARGGGSIPHATRRRLQALVDTGSLAVRERLEIQEVVPGNDHLLVCFSDGSTAPFDRIWVATGGRVDVARDALCQPLLAAHPLPIAGGLPDLGPDLCWTGTNVHLVGAAAGLVIGPSAGNLIGHRRAAQRLLAAWHGADPERADHIRTGVGACPRHHQPAQPTRRVIASTSGPPRRERRAAATAPTATSTHGRDSHRP
ncbi:MAG: SidA/IucD/PvdA family monooxygenase [Nitriliruptoraceae bacterium]|nr:SidA/IucD/PvdA family monooxygenase [Nitriliruptoraceae bacterium]